MLVIFAYSQLATYAFLATGACLIEPVLAVDVVGHQLVGAEGTTSEGEVGAFVVEFVIELKGSKVGVELIFLLSILIHEERLCVGRGSEACLAVGGSEAVVVD